MGWDSGAHSAPSQSWNQEPASWVLAITDKRHLGWKMVWETVAMATPPPGPAPSPTGSSCLPKGA